MSRTRIAQHPDHERPGIDGVVSGTAGEDDRIGLGPARRRNDGDIEADPPAGAPCDLHASKRPHSAVRWTPASSQALSHGGREAVSDRVHAAVEEEEEEEAPTASRLDYTL